APTPLQRQDAHDSALRSGRPRCRYVHRDSRHGFWWISRPESGPEPVQRAHRFFSRACGVLMGADNRRIDKEVACLGRGVRLETLPKLAPEPTPFPAAQAVVHRIPVAKRLWQVTPRRPGTGEGQNGFDEHPIAEHWGPPSTGCDGGEDGGNLGPYLIGQQ